MKSLLSMMALAVSAFGADISGSWKGTAETQAGSIERTFQFRQDGTKLTGETTSQMLGKSVINDGKVEGDTVTFTITVSFDGNEMKLNYNGKIEGDQIKFHVEGVGGGPSIDYVAKKI